MDLGGHNSSHNTPFGEESYKVVTIFFFLWPFLIYDRRL